jgi:hypothetical protein
LDRSSCTMRSKPDDRAACCAIVGAFNWGARQPGVSSGSCPWKDRRGKGLGAMREVASDSDSSNSSRPDVKSAVPAPPARPTKPKPRLSASSPSALLGEPVTMSRSTKIVGGYHYATLLPYYFPVSIIQQPLQALLLDGHLFGPMIRRRFLIVQHHF